MAGQRVCGLRTESCSRGSVAVIGVTTPGRPARRIALLLRWWPAPPPADSRPALWSDASTDCAAASAPGDTSASPMALMTSWCAGSWSLRIVELREHDKRLEDAIVQKSLQPYIASGGRSKLQHRQRLAPSAIRQRNDVAVAESLAAGATLPFARLPGPPACTTSLRAPSRNPACTRKACS